MAQKELLQPLEWFLRIYPFSSEAAPQNSESDPSKIEVWEYHSSAKIPLCSEQIPNPYMAYNTHMM